MHSKERLIAKEELYNKIIYTLEIHDYYRGSLSKRNSKNHINIKLQSN